MEVGVFQSTAPAGCVADNLRFGREFNQPLGIGVLSRGLVRFIMGMNFNQVLVVPDSLKHLTTHSDFEQAVVMPRNAVHVVSSGFKSW